MSCVEDFTSTLKQNTTHYYSVSKQNMTHTELCGKLHLLYNTLKQKSVPLLLSVTLMTATSSTILFKNKIH